MRIDCRSMTIELALASSSRGTSRGAGGGMASSPCTALPPGFRFHPTDEELILHYLRKRAAAAPCPAPVVAEVDIYKFDPWDLPAKAVFGEAEWYFFSPRDRKYPNGVRPNRAAGSGYWKATGTDKPITLSSSSDGAADPSSPEGGRAMIGVKKALVFYKGRPPKGLKTSWIMHEYRLAEAVAAASAYRPMRFKSASMRLDDWVLCRIYKKTSPQPLYSSPSTDDGGADLVGQQQQQQQHLLDDSAASLLPRPPSVSDYLVDYNYSAVPELYDGLLPPLETPPPLQLGTDAGSSGAAATRSFYIASNEPADSSLAQQSSHKRQFMEDYSGSGMEMLHASNKRVMSSDHASSMAVNNSFSLFEPGQTSSLHQDRRI